MSIPIRQSTAFECSIGPVLDADGVAVTDCVVGDFKLKKTTGNFAALNGSATLAHVSAGTYDLVLTTSDTDTVGLLTVAIDDTVNACAPVRMQVMEEVVYDALYAASANTFTGAAGSTKVTGVVLTDTTTTATTATNLTNLPAITSNWLTATGLDSTAVNEIADGILGRDASGSTTNSTLGAIINDLEDGGRTDLLIDGILEDTGTTLPATLGTPANLGGGATVAANLSDIHNDTATIADVISTLTGVVMATAVIGSTGNSTTAIHLSTLTYGNDEINDHLLVIYDNSTGESHSRWITAWSNASKLATVATLPFTPENAVDTYFLMSTRRDVTASTVSDKTGYSLSSTGLDSVTLPANLITATSITNDAITAAKIANGAIDAATFAADVDAEILSYLVDDATRIDASALNTAATAVGSNGSGLTGAGGTGDHLTAVPWNASWDAEVESEANDALVAIHLDHLLAATYDPASKPGAADALLNELIESDAGVSRYTANALEQGPSGGGGVADWTADERTAIRSILGIPASGTTPDDPTTGILDTIRDAVGVVDGIVDDILVDTAVIGAAGAGLSAIQLPSNGLANVTAWTVAITGNITGNLSGSVGSVTGAVGSVTGAVGSVTGNVGGNVTGSVGSVLGGINTTAGVITTLDALDTAQDTQHSTTQGLVTTADAVIDSVLVDTTQIKADLPTRITKNTELAAFPFTMVLTSDHVTGATSKAVTATRSIDGGAFASCANAVSEIANGWYKITLAAADLNGNTIALRFTATDCDDRVITIVTQP